MTLEMEGKLRKKRGPSPPEAFDSSSAMISCLFWKYGGGEGGILVINLPYKLGFQALIYTGRIYRISTTLFEVSDTQQTVL